MTEIQTLKSIMWIDPHTPMVRDLSDKIIRHSATLRRLFLKDENDQTKADHPPTKYKYLQLELLWDNVTGIKQEYQEKVKLNPYIRNITVDPLTHENMPDFVNLFNRILLTSPDPYREMQYKEAEIFGEGTFLASLWNQPVGFLVLTLERNEEKELVNLTIDRIIAVVGK